MLMKNRGVGGLCKIHVVWTVNRYEKWWTHSTVKISEVVSHFAIVQSNSVALEGSCHSMIYYRSVIQILSLNLVMCVEERTQYKKAGQ